MVKDAWHDQEFATQWDESANCYTNPDRLRQLDLVSHLVAAENPRRLLDLGIGSARVELALMGYAPGLMTSCHITGVDSSSAMLDLASHTLAENQIPNVSLVQYDFDSINSLNLKESPDAVICVQALHEVSDETKRNVFQWVSDMLNPGQPFYILDRFVYSLMPWESDLKAIWQWMGASLDQEVMVFDQYHQKYSAKTDSVAELSNYLGWLEQAGFQCIAPYQCFNRALIIARKK